ncbi:MAG: bacteriophage-like [Beijerinckiaceae bacterium]|nr:MAG: bacteriophage-like [Beijerinckiaceae bacterium]
MQDVPLGPALLGPAGMSDHNVVSLDAWRDFNDATPQVDPFDVEPDREQIAVFLDVVFGYCDGWVPLRGFIDKGQGIDGRPHNAWIEADANLLEKAIAFAGWAAREGAAFYVVPGTVAESGKAKSVDVRQMQTMLVDLDAGDIAAKLDHLIRHLGEPTLIVESGGRTPDGLDKLHVWWRLNEPAEAEDITLLCRLRGDIAIKVGGDTHFRSAHQPIRMAGSIYHKGGFKRLVTIRRYNSHVEVDLRDFAEQVDAMPPLVGVGSEPGPATSKPSIADVLTTPVREGSEDAWTRFQGASAAIGHFIRLAHEGRMSRDDAWEAICQYNAAMLRPSWPLERLATEAQRLWRLHEERHGPPLERLAVPPMSLLPAFTLGTLLDDSSPMPDDIIGPRVLTPGGMLVLGGAPKVGKSDFLISLLVHMAAGIPFLGFAPCRPLRIFYLQAEIQYHYLRERLQGIRLDPALLSAARNNLVATPKVRMLLDAGGVSRAVAAARAHYGHGAPDILCVDPIRNLFDGGPDGGGENDNTAMLFFLQERVEVFRDSVAPDAGLILCHHTRKITKKQLAEDPFMALSGAGSLRSFYTSGIIMHRPDEERPERMLHFELRNGPGIEPKIIDKTDGRWVEVDRSGERLVRKSLGERLDAERVRKHDVILGILLDEALDGRLYTINQFAEAFENRGGLGGKDTIRDRLNVLATKGFVKFVRDGAPYGFGPSRSRFGFLCVEAMAIPTDGEAVDPETGEVSQATIAVLPTHYKSPQTGALLEVENPHVWVYPEGEPS